MQTIQLDLLDHVTGGEAPPPRPTTPEVLGYCAGYAAQGLRQGESPAQVGRDYRECVDALTRPVPERRRTTSGVR
ncbi:MAG: hypothetical protein QM831_30815 [Kofleriaceae bacterium]